MTRFNKREQRIYDWYVLLWDEIFNVSITKNNSLADKVYFVLQNHYALRGMNEN